MASSKALVCKDWVPPKAADSASIVVLVILLKGSCSVKLQPEVCECVRSAKDFWFFGWNCVKRFAQIYRAARIFAISIKWFMPTAQKNESLGAKSSMFIP